MKPGTKWFGINAIPTLASGPILYFLDDPIEPFAPEWLPWVLLGPAALSAFALIRMLKPKSFHKQPPATEPAMTLESAQKDIAILGATSIVLPTVFGFFAARASGTFWPFPLFLVLSAVSGFFAWNRVGVIQEALSESWGEYEASSQPPN